MPRRDEDVVVIDRGGESGLAWFVVGALVGAGLALLYAPARGRETRRALRTRIDSIRRLADDKLEGLAEQLGAAETADDDDLDEDDDATPRQQLERRLAEARARRRAERQAVAEADDGDGV